jgi:small GTP-binding protein
MEAAVSDEQKNGKSSRKGRARASARDLFSVAALLKLPGNLATFRRFLVLTKWDDLHAEIAGELSRRVAIVGLANSGKSTLFNTLSGKYASPVSPTEGTTVTLIRGNFGPFVLIDTPGHLPDVQRAGVEESSLAVLLLDATKPVRDDDRRLLRELQKTGRPLIVVLNKLDAVRGDPDDIAGEWAARLGVQDVIPISALSGSNVAEELIPALLEASPEAAMAIGRALPGYRRQAALKLVRTATLIGLAAGMEPIPLIDIPILLGNQIRLVLRIAAVYGEPMSAKHTRELAATILGGLGLRLLAEEVAKLVPVGGDVVSGAIAAAGTWAIGQVAIEYFEQGKQMSAKQLNELFQRYYQRYRTTPPDRQLTPGDESVPSPTRHADD